MGIASNNEVFPQTFSTLSISCRREWHKHHSGHTCRKPGNPSRHNLVESTCYCVLNISRRPPLVSIPAATALAGALCTVLPLVFNASLLTRPAAPAWLLSQRPPHCFWDLSKPATRLTSQWMPFTFQACLPRELHLRSFQSTSFTTATGTLHTAPQMQDGP